MINETTQKTNHFSDSLVEKLKHKTDYTQHLPLFTPVSTPPRTVTKTKTSRRIFLRWGTFAAAGAVLSACNSTSPLTPFSAQPETPEKIQLVYQDWRTEWFPPMVQQLLAEFHESHPHIHVFYTPDPENLEEKMLADLQAGSAPDIFEGCCDFFPIWAQQGYALDLRPYVEADLDQATIADWNPAQYRSFFTRDGRQYGLPKYHGALALYFNKISLISMRRDIPPVPGLSPTTWPRCASLPMIVMVTVKLTSGVVWLTLPGIGFNSTPTVGGVTL